MSILENCFKFFKNRKFLFIFIIFGVLVTALGIGFSYEYLFKREDDIESGGAVVSNGRGCAQIGSQMLRKGGSAADAIISVLLCEGVMLPQSMGVGGGFVATIYTKSKRKIETLVARETAPSEATMDMFVGQQSVTGAKSCAVPAELLGYYELHKKYGKLPWKDLFKPTIDLCTKGYRVSRYLAEDIKRNEESLKNESSMAEIFFYSDGTPFEENHLANRSKLGETLTMIADRGIQEMYGGGELGRKFIEDVRASGGVLTEKDLQDYRVRWNDSNYIKTQITDDGLTLYTSPLPTSGVLVSFMLSVIRGLYTNKKEVYWQRVVETFKHAYGRRSILGDKDGDPEVQAEIEADFKNLLDADFIKSIQKLIRDNETFQDYEYYGANFANTEDKGTANMAVLAPNGDAITVTSTINNEFGSKVRSRQTGIILNDEMDDFSTPGVINAYGIPASPTNYIKPGKRPMSSMCPSIILDKEGNVRMLVGAAGGTKITTSVVTAIVKYIFLKQSLRRAIDDGRLHHQLAPMELGAEVHVPEKIKNYLKKVGHDVVKIEPGSSFSAVTAIGSLNEKPNPHFDTRRIGSKAIIKP